MSRWRIILTGIRQPRPKRDTPKTRYFANVRSGSSDVGAARLVAMSYDLPTVDEAPLEWALASPKRYGYSPRLIDWKLEEIERLLFLQYLRESGRIGGPGD